MGQTLSSSASNQDQDGDVIMVDDSDNSIVDASGLEFNHTGTTYSRRVRTQASRTSSQDRTQFTASSTIEQAPQNGSQRVLRMTPARRRRQQLSSLYPFFSSAATTNQSPIPISRPLNRHQRLHHNTIEDVSFAPRQTDAIAPNLLRRSRNRSSSYNGQDTSANTGIMFNGSESTRNTLPTSETVFDIRRPRSSSVDAIVNGDLDGDLTRPNVRLSDRLRRSNTHRGSSTRQYSSSISLSSTSSSNSSSSTAGTQTDSLATSPQRSRRRVTRISARRLFNFGGQDSESNSNNNNNNSNNNEDDADNHHLGRFLSIAAAATAASLVASQENAVIEAERAANEGHDGSFESFLAALQRRRREASNRSTNQSTTTTSSSEEQDPSVDNNAAGSQPSQPMSFFRLFRFGGSRSSSLSQQNIIPETGANVTSSIPNVTSDTNSSNAPHMVPVIIIGIRSVQPRDEQNGNSSSTQNVDNNSTNLESRNNSSRSSRTRSSSTSSRASVRSTASTATQTPPARSWIIYVLGGTYPSTHPILTTPSLFSDNPTYEDMMLLSSLIGPARPVTTTQSEIDANLPIAFYNESIDLLGNAEKCQVCLCDYVANEEIRVLNCRHGFHRECIDKWLTEGSNKCPICRGIGVPSRESETNNSGPIPTTSTGLDSMGPFF